MERRLFLLALILFSTSVWAGKPSYYLPHPIGWMHGLPVGEDPGWSGSFWLNFEINHGNIWNEQFDMINNKTGKKLTYSADFEQTSLITDFGFALSESFAIGFTAPFASRGGGIMDDFIDQFHVFIGSERFQRNSNHEFGKSYVVNTADSNQFGEKKWSAVNYVKYKAKYWLWQWQGSLEGSCDCGFSIGGQVKVPLGDSRGGMSSGHHDYTLTTHLGVPFGQNSGMWATAAFTSLGRNEIYRDWPMRRFAQMYELTMDLGYEHWGLLLQARTESPIMNKNDLSYTYTTTDPQSQVAYRVASGWNSLVYWRGSQSLGVRWRSLTGHQINFLIVEDWAIGSQDSRVDHLYVNNAPDVAFVTQFHFTF